MNIVLIQTDQQRRDSLPAYGNTVVETPTIDRLAREGVVFDNCFTPAPLCSPARASLLTGKFPTHHGILRNPESGSPAGRDFVGRHTTFSEVLSDRGYDCTHVGKWHVGTELRPDECGFTGVYYPGYGYPDEHEHYLAYLEKIGVGGFKLRDQVYGKYKDGRDKEVFIMSAVQEGGVEASVPCYLANQALDAIRGAHAAKKDFFVRCDFWGPHVPYIIPQEYMDKYAPGDIPKYPNFEDALEGKPPVQQMMKDYWGVQDFGWEEWSRLVAACYGYISLIDDQVGRIVSLLDELGIREETAIFFTSDHGGMVGAHGLCDKGAYLYDEICRIPLIASVPGLKGGTRNDAYVYNMDLMPTFLDVAGEPVPGGIDAASLFPLLDGSADRVRDPVAYTEFYGHQIPCFQRIIRTDDYKYIFNGADRDELYDLRKDPGELANVIAEPGYAGILKDALERMHATITEMKDPILRYFVNTRLG